MAHPSIITTHESLSSLDASAFSLRAVFFSALSFNPPYIIQIFLEVAFWSADGPSHYFSLLFRIIKPDFHDALFYVSILGAAEHVFFEELLRLLIWVIWARLCQSIEEWLESSQTTTSFMFLLSYKLVLQCEIEVSGRFTSEQRLRVLDLSRAHARTEASLNIHPRLWRLCFGLLFANSDILNLSFILWYYDAVFELERLSNI